MIKFAYLIVAVTLICACEKVVTLDLDERDPRIVVDALLTNENTTHYVKLTKTSKYTFKYTPAMAEVEKGATVIITDNTGLTDTLTEVSPGNYATHIGKMQGVVGRSYKIDIYTTAGKHFTSNMEEMVDVPKIDSIYFERDKNDISPENPKQYKFRIYCNMHDPANVENYYLRSVSYYWAKQWHDNIQWNWVFNDKYFNGLYLQKTMIQENYGGVDWIFRLNQYSLNKNAYKFWLQVHLQTMETDSDLTNTSVPLIGNVYNANNPSDYTLGYFQVSAKTTAEVHINK